MKKGKLIAAIATAACMAFAFAIYWDNRCKGG